MDQLPFFLWRLVSNIQEDFTAAEVNHLIQMMDSLNMGEAARADFSVIFHGSRVPFRVILYRYEETFVGLYLKAPWSFAQMVEREVKDFYAEVRRRLEHGME